MSELKAASELAYLRWFYVNVDSYPRHARWDETLEAMERDFVDQTGKRPPKFYGTGQYD